MYPIYNNTPNSMQNNAQAFHANLLSKLAITEGTVSIANNSENKSINEFIVTDATIQQEIVLSPKDFTKKLEAGEINNKTANKIKVTGDLFFVSSDFLKTLPPHLEVEGILSIRYCENFTTFPKNLTAKTLFIASCNQVTTLGENISIKENISVHDCENLTRFSPVNLTFNLEGFFSVKSCPKLESLPDFTRIGTKLIIEKCPLLVNLPETANIAGDIEIKHCPNITTMPVSWSTDLVATNNDLKVTLVNTRIPIEQIAQYNQASATNVKFVLGVDEHSKLPFNNLEEAFFYWNQIADNAVEIPTVTAMAQQLTTQQQEDFCKLFFVLVKSAQGGPYRLKKTANKIMQIPHFLNTANESTKASSFEYMKNNAIACFPDCRRGVEYKEALKRFTY